MTSFNCMHPWGGPVHLRLSFMGPAVTSDTPSARQLVRQDGGGRPYFAIPDLSSLSRRAYQLAGARQRLSGKAAASHD
jgi:hypothetical protein